jgi:hypothetical protein
MMTRKSDQGIGESRLASITLIARIRLKNNGQLDRVALLNLAPSDQLQLLLTARLLFGVEYGKKTVKVN